MGRLTVRVDRDLCEQSGRCARQAPEVFELDDELRILVEHPTEDQREAVEVAVDKCPRMALRLTEEE